MGLAYPHDSSKHIISNEDGIGTLTFQVQQLEEPAASKPPVTAQTLKDRGLDLSNARDLGVEGLPLLSEEQRQRLEEVWIQCEEALAEDPKRPGTSDFMLIRLNTGDAPAQASKPYSH